MKILIPLDDNGELKVSEKTKSKKDIDKDKDSTKEEENCIK